MKLTRRTYQILQIIKENSPVRLKDIAKISRITKKNLYIYIKVLIDENLISKYGTVPNVYYQVVEYQNGQILALNMNDLKIENNYIYISPSGEIVRGLVGFYEWCYKNKFDFESEKLKLVRRLRDIERIKHRSFKLISGKKSILSGRIKPDLKNIFFSDFYTVDYFGKTKLGQLIYIAKSSQNIKLISEIVQIIRPNILKLIDYYNIKFVAFIPPTLKRQVQFMDVIEDRLNLHIPTIHLEKVKREHLIAQKTIRKLEDRIENARATIIVSNISQKIDANVLIIDDATGSGSTLNECAKKIKKLAKGKVNIYGYSVVGSSKGFDVISEV